jgi:hypothetical protein
VSFRITDMWPRPASRVRGHTRGVRSICARQLQRVLEERRMTSCRIRQRDSWQHGRLDLIIQDKNLACQYRAINSGGKVPCRRDASTVRLARSTASATGSPLNAIKASGESQFPDIRATNPGHCAIGVDAKCNHAYTRYTHISSRSG